MGVFRQFGECRLGLRPAKNGIAEQPLSPKVHFTPWGVGWGGCGRRTTFGMFCGFPATVCRQAQGG